MKQNRQKITTSICVKQYFNSNARKTKQELDPSEQI